MKVYWTLIQSHWKMLTWSSNGPLRSERRPSTGLNTMKCCILQRSRFISFVNTARLRYHIVIVIEIRAAPIYVATWRNTAHTLGMCASTPSTHWMGCIYTLDETVQVITALWHLSDSARCCYEFSSRPTCYLLLWKTKSFIKCSIKLFPTARFRGAKPCRICCPLAPFMQHLNCMKNLLPMSLRWALQ